MPKLDLSELELLNGNNFDTFDCEHCSFAIDFEPIPEADYYIRVCPDCGTKHVIDLNE